jgi:hypothetical protein
MRLNAAAPDSLRDVFPRLGQHERLAYQRWPVLRFRRALSTGKKPAPVLKRMLLDVFRGQLKDFERAAVEALNNEGEVLSDDVHRGFVAQQTSRRFGSFLFRHRFPGLGAKRKPAPKGRLLELAGLGLLAALKTGVAAKGSLSL